MKDKLLFGTIGLLAGIVVMQWTMPSGQATVVTPPVGRVIAMTSSGSVLLADGTQWGLSFSQGQGGPYEWYEIEPPLPVSVDQVQFADQNGFVDKDGNLWYSGAGAWHNVGQPPIGPVSTEQSTWGKVKAKFSGKEE